MPRFYLFSVIEPFYFEFIANPDDRFSRFEGHMSLKYSTLSSRERGGSVVECLTRDRRAAGSSLTGVTALWSLSETHLS